jgi:CxxC motif-containing protein (DUF1111 family)
MFFSKKSLTLMATIAVLMTENVCFAVPPTEAPAGFDGKTNGLVDQGTFDADRLKFEERDTIETGLGPVYNAEACSECHQNPVTGSASQVGVVRAGIFDGSSFKELPGGSLMQDRAINAAIQTRVDNRANVRSFRVSTNILGDGFVEAISDETLKQTAALQPSQSGGGIQGTAVMVEVLEAPGNYRVGRFGWKAQHASLLSFAGDAYRNEVGVTNPLVPTEATPNGRSVAAFDTTPDPEDTGADIADFTVFMRALKTPPRDTVLAATTAARSGEQSFQKIGCGTCHVATFVTAPTGTVINGGTFTVPEALGNKTIHPYSDFLLHDVGTGDGIVQNGGASSRNKLRTAPLWGLRTRSRLLHDGSALTIADAITRHRGEAGKVVNQFNLLGQKEKDNLLSFLNSL